MKKAGIVIWLAVSLAAASGGLQLAEASPSGIRVTFVGNAGFLITVDGKKILIDAMFAGFPGGYVLPKDVREMLLNSHPPFDDVDLILVTHNHGDHFDAPLVRKYLNDNPKSRFISTPQVTGQLEGFGSRVIPLSATKGKPAQACIDGIQIKAVYLSHGTIPAGEEEILNYGYLVTIHAISLFHMGDGDPSLVDLSAPLSPGKTADLAFISHFLLDDDPLNRKFVREWINGKTIFPIHYAYTEPALDRAKVKSFYPDAILFDKEMQSWDRLK